MNLDLPQLSALRAVIDEGSFDAAAAVLHVTPSAISQRIRALEVATGQVLVRRSKPVEITDAGRPFLMLSRQIDILTREALAPIASSNLAPTIPIAVNGDCLNTWVLPALAPLSDRLCFDIRREDQDQSAALLREGAVMAAITADPVAVQGCTSSRLGVMRYRPVASKAFAASWFGHGLKDLTHAPVVNFDRSDELQNRYLKSRKVSADGPPVHFVPASSDYAEAILLGFGWGMMPEQQRREAFRSGDLVEFDKGAAVDVTLYWQQWRLRSPSLTLLSDAIIAAAQAQLRPM